MRAALLLIVGAAVGFALSGLIAMASVVGTPFPAEPVGPDTFPTMQEGYAYCQENDLEFTIFPNGEWVCAEKGAVKP